MQTHTSLQMAKTVMEQNPSPDNINRYLHMAQSVRLPVINRQSKR